VLNEQKLNSFIEWKIWTRNFELLIYLCLCFCSIYLFRAALSLLCIWVPCNHRYLKKIDCSSFVMCPLLVPHLPRHFRLFFSFLAAANNSTKETNKAGGTCHWSVYLTQMSMRAMEQRALKNVNKHLNTNIYTYLETSGGQSSNLYLNAVHFFNTSIN
jgi:hypothetical protein